MTTSVLHFAAHCVPWRFYFRKTDAFWIGKITESSIVHFHSLELRHDRMFSFLYGVLFFVMQHTIYLFFFFLVKARTLEWHFYSFQVGNLKLQFQTECSCPLPGFWMHHWHWSCGEVLTTSTTFHLGFSWALFIRDTNLEGSEWKLIKVMKVITFKIKLPASADL